jgi:carboxyl-terminal processing protease
VLQGVRQLRGAPGTKVKLTVFRGNSNEPHVVELTREASPASDVSGRLAAPGIGYVRIAAINAKTADQARAQVGELAKAGASSLIVDVRRTSSGALDAGISLARLFVPSGTLAVRETKGVPNETIAARPGDGAVSLPMTVLVDTGTSGAAELFASALLGNKRAELIGEHTIGRVGSQKLVKLPDGSGLWLTTTRYLTPSGSPLHERGLEPSVAVDEPDVEFGQPPPPGDAILEKALEQAAEKKAA